MRVIHLLIVVAAILFVGLVAARWAWLTDPANAAGIQALCALAVVVLTIFIAVFIERQTAISGRQLELQERQGQTQSILTSLEYAPIIAAEFAEDYDVNGNCIVLKNGGRGPAHNIRGYSFVMTAPQQFQPVKCRAKPGNLNPNDTGAVEVDLDRVRKLRPSSMAAEARRNDCWVLHYGGVSGETWHTTCNINDKGQRMPLGYFQSWSPRHWRALPRETQDMCMVCLHDAGAREAAERFYTS